jgi:hypothetical protein
VPSNSSADRPAASLLRAAFAVLHDEAPSHADLLCAALARLTVRVEVGDEAIAPRVAEGRLAVGEPTGPAGVTIRAGLPVVLALLDARRTLIEAVARGELDVWGTADALDAAADAFATFLHGLVRAPSGAGLLGELRRRVAGAHQEIDHGQ